MLSKSSAKMFFLVGTGICAITFGLLTWDTFQRIPGQTREANLSDSAKRGKHLFETNNCMGCHTILGEGAYYAPELTKVYDRRGAQFIQGMLKDPNAMYPGQRKMVKYNFKDQEITDLVAFFKWIGEIDLNGYPPQSNLTRIALPTQSGSQKAVVATSIDRPKIFNQMCVACHSLNGEGGNVGPALDTVGARFNRDFFVSWLHDPNKIRPDTKMPKLPLSDEDIIELSAFLSELKGEAK
jgi:nitric oxide reductase subunit C